MPVKRKKGSTKKTKKSSKKDIRVSALLKDPIIPEIIPPPPLPFETLVSILEENPMSDKDVDGIRVTSFIASKLTIQEIRDLHFVFDLFDVDKDGYLQEDGYIRALKCLGLPCSPEQAWRIFHRAAKQASREHAVNVQTENLGEKDGVPSTGEAAQEYKAPAFRGLSVNQFLENIIARQSDAYDYREELALAFKCFDINGSGQITTDSLKSLSRSIGLDLSTKSCQEMISFADRGGDGAVDEEEFTKIMLQTNLYSSHLLGLK